MDNNNRTTEQSIRLVTALERVSGSLLDLSEMYENLAMIPEATAAFALSNLFLSKKKKELEPNVKVEQAPQQIKKLK